MIRHRIKFIIKVIFRTFGYFVKMEINRDNKKVVEVVISIVVLTTLIVEDEQSCLV